MQKRITLNILKHYCPVKMSLPGLKPNTGAGFINPSLKAGVNKAKTFIHWALARVSRTIMILK